MHVYQKVYISRALTLKCLGNNWIVCETRKIAEHTRRILVQAAWGGSHQDSPCLTSLTGDSEVRVLAPRLTNTDIKGDTTSHLLLNQEDITERKVRKPEQIIQQKDRCYESRLEAGDWRCGGNHKTIGGAGEPVFLVALCCVGGGSQVKGVQEAGCTENKGSKRGYVEIYLGILKTLCPTCRGFGFNWPGLCPSGGFPEVPHV